MGFIGLKSTVRFRRELGFVFLDDRFRLYRISDAAYRAICESSVARQELPPEAQAVVDDLMPSVFREFETREGAERSILGKEV